SRAARAASPQAQSTCARRRARLTNAFDPRLACGLEAETWDRLATPGRTNSISVQEGQLASAAGVTAVGDPVQQAAVAVCLGAGAHEAEALGRPVSRNSALRSCASLGAHARWPSGKRGHASPAVSASKCIGAAGSQSG